VDWAMSVDSTISVAARIPDRGSSPASEEP